MTMAEEKSLIPTSWELKVASGLKKITNDEEIKKLQEYKGLTLTKVDDVEEYEAIKEKWQEVRNKRLETTKWLKTVKDPINAIRKRIVDTENAVKTALTPTEDSLRAEMARHENWKEAEKKKREQERKKRMEDAGYIEGANQWISADGNFIISFDDFKNEYDEKIEEWVKNGESDQLLKKQKDELFEKRRQEEAEAEAERKRREQEKQPEVSPAQSVGHRRHKATEDGRIEDEVEEFQTGIPGGGDYETGYEAGYKDGFEMFKKRAILLLKMKKVDQEIINAIKEHTV